MSEPWELTDEEAAAEGKRMAPRRDEADRVDAYFYAEVHALLNASDDEFAALLPEEAKAVREYLAGHLRDADA